MIGLYYYLKTTKRSLNFIFISIVSYYRQLPVDIKELLDLFQFVLAPSGQSPRHTKLATWFFLSFVENCLYYDVLDDYNTWFFSTAQKRLYSGGYSSVIGFEAILEIGLVLCEMSNCDFKMLFIIVSIIIKNCRG